MRTLTILTYITGIRTTEGVSLMRCAALLIALTCVVNAGAQSQTACVATIVANTCGLEAGLDRFGNTTKTRAQTGSRNSSARTGESIRLSERRARERPDLHESHERRAHYRLRCE